MSAVFSIDKNKVKQSFAMAAKSYDNLASLQRKVGLDLLRQFVENNISLMCADNLIVDIGCGTGFLTQELLHKTAITKIVAIDIALPMLQITRTKIQNKKMVTYICADAEHLPLLNHSIDKIISNLALQWCQNLIPVFGGFKKALKQDGQIFFSTFGPATLQELKQAWSEVDNYSHVNEFYTTKELLFFLKQAGFNEIAIKSTQYQSNYQTVLELMRELKGIGAHNVLSGRNKKTTSKSKMQDMITAYDKSRIYGMIPATYDIIFVSAKVAP